MKRAFRALQIIIMLKILLKQAKVEVNMKKIVINIFLVVFLVSCGSKYYGYMNSKLMNQLKLGMTTEQVTEILGNAYKISQNKIENGKEIKIFSYRNIDEFYLFTFENNNLKSWDRELLPVIEVKQN